MRRIIALFVTLAVVTCSLTMPPFPAERATAYAGQSTPYTFTYTYYSDLAFTEGGSVTLAVGTTRKIGLVNRSGAIQWTSSNEKVATVTPTGTVRAKRAGLARITAKNLETSRSIVCTVKVYKKRTRVQVRKSILALEKTYAPGRRWTNENYYYWQAANCHCYGCIAFVGIASDAAFGKYAPLKRHNKFSKIKAGDHVRIAGNHSVIVLRKHKKSIVVAEGNYNDTFNWGRRISYAKLRREGFYVETRY